jgi:hypothetical protein
MLSAATYRLRGVHLGPWLWAALIACGLLLALSVVSLNYAASPQSYRCYDVTQAPEGPRSGGPTVSAAPTDCPCYPPGEEPARFARFRTSFTHTFEGAPDRAGIVLALGALAGLAVAVVAVIVTPLGWGNDGAPGRPLVRAPYVLLGLLGVAGVATILVAGYMVVDNQLLGPCDGG